MVPACAGIFTQDGKPGQVDKLPLHTDDDDEEGEQVETLPMDAQLHDPLRHARIRSVTDGVVRFGFVETIDIGTVSKQRLYHIRYTTGDWQHYTADQVIMDICTDGD